jgi:hypothetical protein
MAYGECGSGGVIVEYPGPEHVLRGLRLRRKTPDRLLFGY